MSRWQKCYIMWYDQVEYAGTTCYWFQIIIYTSEIIVNWIWNQTLVNLYNIRVYITCLLDLYYFRQLPGFKTLTFTYLNDIKLLTCRYRFPTHSAWSRYICYKWRWYLSWQQNHRKWMLSGSISDAPVCTFVYWNFYYHRSILRKLTPLN